MRLILAAATLVGLCASAWAQGYVVTKADGRLEERPGTAVPLDVASDDPSRASVSVDLPFVFPYYGRRCTTLVVSAHGWALPGAKTGFAPADAPPAGFPFAAGAGADGVVAPMWTRLRFVDDRTPDAALVHVWTAGAAPERRFVVSWEKVATADGPRTTFQLQLFEGPGRIVFAYSTSASDSAPPSARYVCGLDEPGGPRFTAPLAAGATNVGPPPTDFVFEPRTVVVAGPSAARASEPVAWEHVKRESVSGEGTSRTACYVAKGRLWLLAADRALHLNDPKAGRRELPQRKAELVAEDRAAFGGAGDARRFIRQAMDGKAILIPTAGGEPVRLWFRVVEWFEIDDWGFGGADEHVWNLRWMLSRAFPADDARSRIDSYCAWRGMVSSRLSVVKLFDFDAPGDAGRQFSTGHANEYALWCMRMKEGPRGPLGPFEAPGAGWLRFVMKDDDRNVVQHAEKGDLRCVPDPEYVDGFYEYVVRSDDGTGWAWCSKRRPTAATDEPFDFDPGSSAGPTTPR